MFSLYFDGSATPNPGDTGLGFSLCNEAGIEVAFDAVFGGHGTNNEAEYKSLVLGLQAALDYGALSLRVFGDSQLVIKQMTGEWSVGKPELKALHREASALAKKFHAISFEWIRREQNVRADELSKLGVARREGKKALDSMNTEPAAPHPPPCQETVVPAATKTGSQSVRVTPTHVIFVQGGNISLVDRKTGKCSCADYRQRHHCQHSNLVSSALKRQLCSQVKQAG